jgi:hypothetical protein
MDAKEGQDREKIDLKRMLGPIVLVVFVGLLGLGLTEDYLKDSSDSIDYFSNSEGVLYHEAKCLYGSALNTDSILVADDNIKIMHQHQWFGKKTETVPYNSIKEVIFGKAIGGYKVEILKAGKHFGTDNYVFYVNQKDTFNQMNSDLKIKGSNRFPITEEL